jgi:hypothetical protein
MILFWRLENFFVSLYQQKGVKGCTHRAIQSKNGKDMKTEKHIARIEARQMSKEAKKMALYSLALRLIPNSPAQNKVKEALKKYE